MSDTTPTARRPSGRDARRAARATALPDHLRPVSPGMESGRYKPLSDSDIQQIHQTALRLLEEVGLADALSLAPQLLAGQVRGRVVVNVRR